MNYDLYFYDLRDYDLVFYMQCGITGVRFRWLLVLVLSDAMHWQWMWTVMASLKPLDLEATHCFLLRSLATGTGVLAACMRQSLRVYLQVHQTGQLQRCCSRSAHSAFPQSR
jgi:hypothetical protein